MQMYYESENPYFSCIFFEHGYLTYCSTYLFENCIAEICMEGTVSQNFDLGLSFCFMLCRRKNLEKKYKKITKVTRFSTQRKN